MPASLSLRFDILCTALAIFDKSSDLERVLNSMQFKTNFNVDSYFRFVLSDLRNKWQDICDLFYNNLPELVSSDAFYELMKYLIKITETALDFVFVSIADNNVYIKDIAGKLLVPPIEIKSNDVYTSVILELVSLAPANIVLNFAQDGAQDLGSCLQNLFDSKVVYST